MKLSRDGWGGLAVLAASLLLFWGTLGLKDNPLVPIGPGFYPRIVLGLTAVLSLWLLIADAFAKKPPAANTIETTITRKRLRSDQSMIYVSMAGSFTFCDPRRSSRRRSRPS